MNNMNIKKLEYGLLSNNLNKRIDNTQKLKNKQSSFKEILDNLSDESEIKFSKHAQERLNSRNIELTNSDHKRLGDAFAKAEEKGVNDALILMDDKAFIANIKNKTIITTVGENQDKIFTNIDGAVII